jgi:valyl-tRNA synthetase
MLPTARASRIVRRSMPKPFFITTAIDYTNGAPHIGHAYEKVLADVLARYHRLKGDAENPQEVFYLTGVDQHAKIHRAVGEARREIQRLGGDDRSAPQGMRAREPAKALGR